MAAIRPASDLSFIATPMPTIYTWLDEVGYGVLKGSENQNARTQVAAASAAPSEENGRNP